MTAYVLINVLWPPLAFFVFIALGKLVFDRPRRSRRGRRR